MRFSRLAAFVVAGRGLGASGAFATTASGIVAAVAPHRAAGSAYFSRSFEGFDKQGAYSISVVLAVIALLTVLLMTLLRPKNQEA